MAGRTRNKVKVVDNTQIVNDYDVYDQTGEQKSAEWLYQNFDGFEVLRTTVENSKSFRVVAVYVTEGPATFVAEVRAQNGSGQPNQPIAFSYPTLEHPDPNLTSISQYNVPQLWTTRVVTPQRTNGEGITGFGLGSSYGPFYSSFVLSPTLPSDCVTKAGMKGGTNHVGPLHVVWQITETVVNEFLPWDEPEADIPTTMEKVRWWTEEMVRSRESGKVSRADRIQYALVDTNRGLMYRLEEMLKSENSKEN